MHDAMETPYRLQQLYFGWLIGYSGLRGPIAGIMISDYFLVRKTRLDVASLYRRNSAYEYRNGFNPRALIALGAGIAVALCGLIFPGLRPLYDYAWFVGFAVSGFVYYLTS